MDPEVILFDNPKKERTLAFMKGITSFNWDVDVEDTNIGGLLDALMEYGRKNGLPKKLTYRVALVVEESLAYSFRNCDNLRCISLSVGYSADRSSAKVDLYIDGDEKEVVSNDEFQNKLLESYCKNIKYNSKESGYIYHTSFDVGIE